MLNKLLPLISFIFFVPFFFTTNGQYNLVSNLNGICIPLFLFTWIFILNSKDKSFYKSWARFNLSIAAILMLLVTFAQFESTYNYLNKTLSFYDTFGIFVYTLIGFVLMFISTISRLIVITNDSSGPKSIFK